MGGSPSLRLAGASSPGGYQRARILDRFHPSQGFRGRLERTRVGQTHSHYREWLGTVCGCNSSTDPRLGDHSLDTLLALFEAIHWRKVDAGQLQPSCKATAVFRQRGFWKARNNRAENSRDRYVERSLTEQIEELEKEFAALGCGPHYCETIRQRATSGRGGTQALHSYLHAMKRTLKSKQGHLQPVSPF